MSLLSEMGITRQYDDLDCFEASCYAIIKEELGKEEMRKMKAQSRRKR